ncbi:MAG: tetratricopeptide repeat protein [Actinobacteria bacterium]|nr:tetratricopeptide repeat protein [Actinomycetota bacterium]
MKPAPVQGADRLTAWMRVMEPLRVYLFGGFFMERAGKALPPIASRVGRSLFAHLVMHRGRPLQRDLLAGSFWPDLPEGRARRRLSHTLWQIQDTVSDGSASHLATTADTLAFDTTAPYWLDVEEFDHLFDSLEISRRDTQLGRAGDAAALRACVELYRGDFLAGFFDNWVVVEQDHYRQRYLVALSRLVEVTKAQGAYEEALAHARRLTHHDPLREEAHQEVMRLCFLLGRTSDAVQQFERCRSVLAEELGTEPSEPTVELYRRILRQRRAAIRPLQGEERATLLGSRSGIPFVGREEERRSLIGHLERVLAGPGGVVLVEGEPGIGKTRLALEAADAARWRGFEVSWGTCVQGTLRPFGPLVEVLESISPLRAEQLSEQLKPVWLTEAMRLAPRLGKRNVLPSTSTPLRPAEESTRMQEALVLTLGALGRIAPHLVIVDDVHWADQDTLGVLTQLGPRLAESRILLLLLYRSEEGRGDPEVWDVLRDLDRVAGLGRVVLSPLSVFELGDMVKAILGLTSMEPMVAARLHRRTGGNVLFTLETLLALRDQGLFEVGGDPGGVLERELAGRTIAVAPRVRSVIDARTSLLGEHAHAVFKVAAVCGGAVDLAMLAAVVGLPRASVLDAMDDLIHRGLIREEGDSRYRVSHDLVREVVYESLDEGHRVELHRRVAAALVDIDAEDVDAIGYHYWEGGIPERAAHFLLEAGIRAEELHAFATARQHFQAAQEAAAYAKWLPGDRYRLAGHLETVLSVLGRRNEQAEVIEGMARLVEERPSLRGDLERRRAWLLAHTGRFAEAEKSARQSVDAERRRGDRGALAAALVALGTCQRWSGHPLEAVSQLEAAVVAARGDDQRRAEAHIELGSTLVEVQRSTEALPHLERALALFEKSSDLRGEAEVFGSKARALRQLGDTDGSLVHYGRAIEICQKIGYRHGEGVNWVNQSNLHYFLGQVAGALSGYEQAARIFAELGDLRGEAMVRVNAASVRQSLLGDCRRATADAQRAMTHFLNIGDRARQAQCMEVLAGVALLQDRPDEAERLLEESYLTLTGTGNRFLEGQHLRSLALLHLATGNHQDALVALDRADRICVETGLVSLAVELLSIRGATLLAGGHVQEAFAVTRQAVEQLVPGVERVHLIHHRHAVAARAAGQRQEARRAAAEAYRLLNATLQGLPAEDREGALERVAEHREIVAAWNQYSPHTVEVLLPAAGTPIGRALADDELRQVTWTVTDPEDEQVSSPIDRRRRRLWRLMTEAGDQGAVPSIDQLAGVLNVSASTVGRDLVALRNAGHRLATRGQKPRAS